MGRTWRNRLLNGLPYSLLLLGLLVAAVSAARLLVQQFQQGSSPGTATSPGHSTTGQTLERLQRRLRVLPDDQDAYVQLGNAYLQRGRETGDPSYYAKAEEAVKKALELDPGSPGAMSAMGALALGRHQFREAAEWARRALEAGPVDASASATYGLLGDAQVELGQYQEAIQSYQTMVALKPNLDSYARVSYIRELMGDPQGAIKAMEMAVAAGSPRGEATAWALVQLGNLQFNAGRLQEAARSYEAALDAFPDYYLALAALGRARAAQGQYDEALHLYQRAADIIPQPTIVAALGDLYAWLGKKAEAQRQYETVEFIAGLGEVNQVIYNRELALFYADHDMALDKALELAAREMAVRRDIYTYDTLAWVLYKNQRLEEAAKAMEEALRLGTQDPMLFFHAGMIYHGLGQAGLALQHLEKTMALNPHFSLLHQDQARQTMEQLRSAGGSGR